MAYSNNLEIAMKPVHKNQNGFALVYALVVLTLATVGGTALLFLVQKDRAMVTDYVKMRSASLAANAAIRACEGQFMNDTGVAIAILRKYKADSTYKWMLGTAPANTEQIKQLWTGNDSPKYSACILGFDQTTYSIVIQGTGYGSYGGKKRSIASFYLGGLTTTTPTTGNRGKFAIYIAKDGDNINYPLTINGNVYFGGHFTTENSGYAITINGYLKTGVSTTEATILNTWIINGNALFQCPVEFANYASTINGKAGFTKNVNCAIGLAMGGDAFFTSTINAGSGFTYKVNMQNHKATYSSSSFPTSYLENASSTVKNTSLDLETSVDICDGDESPVTIDISKIPSGKILSYNNSLGANVDLTGTALNNYIAANPTKLWTVNGSKYLVIRITYNVDFPSFNTTSGIFTGKVIWILENNPGITPNFNWYASDTTSSLTLIYAGGTSAIPNNTQLNPLGWSGNLRGYIYLTGTAAVTYKLVAGAKLKGAINHESAGADLETNSALTINYDDAVVQELVDIGIATRPTVSCAADAGGGLPVRRNLLWLM
jgi:hypothetical protein